MEKHKRNTIDVRSLTLTAILTSLVVVLQYAGAFVRFGPFSISLVLVPIVIGAAQCGVFAGGWLGFVFGMVVLLNGDAGAFLAVDIFGTIVTVLLKGTLCGVCASLIYKAVAKVNRYLAVFSAAIVCPLVNTFIFLVGCNLFFYDTLIEWAGGGEVWEYMIFTLVGGNFLFEILSNILLSPVIVRLLNLAKKTA